MEKKEKSSRNLKVNLFKHLNRETTETSTIQQKGVFLAKRVCGQGNGRKERGKGGREAEALEKQNLIFRKS